MMERNPSPAEVHEQGLPPDGFARAHLEVDPPCGPGESRPAFARRAFLHRRGRLQMLLQAGTVIASGVNVGRGALSADPRCMIHAASWLALSLRGDPGAPDHLPMIDDRVTMPNGDEVVALRLRWASDAATLPLEEASLEERDATRRGSFKVWLTTKMEASPSVRTLVKAEIELEAVRMFVSRRAALKLRSEIIKRDPVRFAAWAATGSTIEERARSRAARAEIKKLEKERAAIEKRSA